MTGDTSEPTEERLPLGVAREGDGYRFSWRAPLLFIGFISATMVVMNYLLLHVLIEAPFKLLVSLALCAQMGAFVVANGVRQQRSLKQGVLRPPWYRFSILEALVITTGFAISLALMAADRESTLHEQQLAEQLNQKIESLLGPDSHAYRNSEGIHVSLCDRTVDDARLAAFTDLADEIGVLDRITTFLIGSNAKNINTPALWPDLTDASVDSLSRWRALEELTLYGASITPEGVVRLAELRRLERLEVTTPLSESFHRRIRDANPKLKVQTAE